MEQWRNVPDYEGLYQVSNKGRVRSLDHIVPGSRGGERLVRGKVLKQTKSGNYFCVHLSKKGKSKVLNTHEIVAFSFLGKRPKGYHIHHKDGNSYNNIPQNLEYLSPFAHAQTVQRRVGEENGFSKLTEGDVRQIRKLWNSNELTQEEIANMFGIEQMAVSSIIRKKTWAWLDPDWKPTGKKIGHRGEKNGSAKLNEKQVKQIRDLYSTRSYSYQDLSNRFDISISVITKIIKRQAWKHVK